MIKQLFNHQKECVQMHILNEWQNCTMRSLGVHLEVQGVRIQYIDPGFIRNDENLEQAYLCLLPVEQ